MNYCPYIVYDLETTGVDPKTAQIVQIGAIAIDSRRLEIIPDSEFQILVKPLYGEEAAKANLSELTDGAIAVHKKTHKLLEEEGVSAESAIQNFVSYVNNYNTSKQKWKSPIASGYNIISYDNNIINRDFARFNVSNPFHPVYSYDLLQQMFLFFENDKAINSLSADSLIRKYMGWKDEGQAHDALSDVKMTAELLIKSLRLIRKSVSRVKFEGCFA